jgi:apolipoprotein N-acyltransferase
MKVQEITEASMSITPALRRPQPETALAPAPAVSGARVLLPLALASGGLLWLCYFPVAWGWLAWVALVPLLLLVRSQARARVIYLSAFVGGLVFYWPVLQWLRVADPRMYWTWAILATYCAAYFPAVIFAVRFLERRTRLPLTITLPVVWTALEFLRCHLGSGFSWYLIGHSQHDWLPIIQIADLTGAYGVSVLVVAVNAVLLEVCWGRTAVRRLLGQGDELPRESRIALAVQACVILLLIAGTIGYGVARMRQAEFTAGPRIALVQGDVPQQIRNDGSRGRELAFTYESLSNLAIMYQPDLIVWPETSYPGEYAELAPGADLARQPERRQHRLRWSRAFTRDAHQLWPTNLLVGINSVVYTVDGKEQRHNSALLIDERGDMIGRYDKIHRVPFGEYVPLRESLPLMKRLAPYDYEYWVEEGREHTRFPLHARGERPCTFGVVICYEDTVPDVTRPYGGGAEAMTDFVVNISNDGWFDGTSEHEEHLAICRFRAVECRRSVVRAVNMGVSAVIDGNGRVLSPCEIAHPEHAALFAGAPLAASVGSLPWPALAINRDEKHRPHVWAIPAVPARQEGLPPSQWKEFKKTAGVLLATVPMDGRSSFYARHGDWLPWTCWILLGAAIVFAALRPRIGLATPGRG